jgi:hypothetical protein
MKAISAYVQIKEVTLEGNQPNSSRQKGPETFASQRGLGRPRQGGSAWEPHEYLGEDAFMIRLPQGMCHY